MSPMLATRLDFTALLNSPSPSPPSGLRVRPSPTAAGMGMAGTRFLSPRAAASATAAVSAKPAAVAPLYADRTVVRIGLPSKGRMSEQTLSLLKSCQLSVRHLNPRQYTADIPQVPNLEVWFQRPKDIVRKLQSGDLDLGIVGFDIVSEYGQGPTISPVYRPGDGKVAVEYYAINVVVPQKSLYKSIQQLRSIGGSGVLVTKLTYIFDEETPRWRKLLSELGL
uniref:Histidine biosynthesis HisG C-terminal domain-containing protein n=1 Tax=Oryza punctata TaxID=4537 RepID=A0A0E0K8F5_ORYPU